MVELDGDFGRQGGVAGGVVGVVVLVGPVGAGQFGQQFSQPGEARGLPAAPLRRTVGDLQPHPVGAQQLAHGRLQFPVADQHDGMAEGLSGEGESDAEGA